MRRLESPESSSPLITRQVEAALQQRSTAAYPLPAWQQYALRLLGLFPQSAARFAISRFEAIGGLPPEAVQKLTTADLVNERLQDYHDLQGAFPCVTVGAALGGAAAHLALALDGPFLPQPFVLTLRGGAPDGDVRTYLQRSKTLALHLARQNPDLLTIQHYDPIHDEWMTRFVNHLRFKLLQLPPEYAAFLRQRLQPGGTVCYLDCGASWLRYRLGERSFFQVGGWGAIPAQEFLQGSARLSEYSRRVGLKYDRWPLDDLPLETGPESEWGSEPGLAEALQEFCRRHGYDFIQIRLPEPHDFSLLAFRAYQRLLERLGRQPAGVLVEMFSQFAAFAPLQSGLLPLWLVFNTADSLAFLRQMRPAFPADQPVFFSPLATFTPTADLSPWEAWESALAGCHWRNIGARPSHYPADAAAVVDWAKPLQKWLAQHTNPLPERLTAAELQALAQQLQEEKRSHSPETIYPPETNEPTTITS